MYMYITDIITDLIATNLVGMAVKHLLDGALHADVSVVHHLQETHARLLALPLSLEGNTQQNTLVGGQLLAAGLPAARLLLATRGWRQ